MDDPVGAVDLGLRKDGTRWYDPTTRSSTGNKAVTLDAC